MALRGADQITIYRALTTDGCPETIAQVVAKRAHAMANRGKDDQSGRDPSASSREAASATGAPPPRPRRPQPPDDKEETRKAGPWARFWARTLDLLVVTPPALILSSTIVTVDSGSSVLFLLAFVVAVLLPFLLDACVVGLFGNSLGKALLGITVLHKDGRKPGFHDTMTRNLYVCGYGYWTGLLPLVSWIPMLLAYRDLCGEKGETKWDAALGYEVCRTSVNLGQIVGFAAALCVTLGVVLSVTKPAAFGPSPLVRQTAQTGVAYVQQPSSGEQRWANSVEAMSRDQQPKTGRFRPLDEEPKTGSIQGGGQTPSPGNYFDRFDAPTTPHPRPALVDDFFPKKTESDRSEQRSSQTRRWGPWMAQRSVEEIERVAKEHEPRLNGPRAWTAVIAWQSAFIQHWNRAANTAMYDAVGMVLAGLNGNEGICSPGDVTIIDAAHATAAMPAGTKSIGYHCAR